MNSDCLEVSIKHFRLGWLFYAIEVVFFSLNFFVFKKSLIKVTHKTILLKSRELFAIKNSFAYLNKCVNISEDINLS